MCGIVGILNLARSEPIDRDSLAAAGAMLRHRGPDDDGLLVRPSFGMAMRRLSIIDLEGGTQPVSNEDGTLHVMYNGEIYNHDALRAELESYGHRFRTRADTEVLVHGYEQWGPDGLLERLRGMFAFALWNDTDETLFLARDRMGIKPLYYTVHDGRLTFSSEIRPLLHLSDMPRHINTSAIGAYMALGFITSPHTMFEGVYKLPPAHSLRVQDGAVTTREYWKLSYEATRRGSEADIVAEFRSRLQDCVSSHMMSEVPLGALLSGGVDSTATAAFMRRTTPAPFVTVTLSFAGQNFDEMSLAADSARELGTDHHTVEFAAGMDDYPEVLSHLEEPTRAVETGIYFLFKACRELGLTVVLTGEGADELLGGYAWHQSGAFDRFLSRLPLGVHTAVTEQAALRMLTQSARHIVRALRGVPTQTHRRYLQMIRTRGAEFAAAVVRPELAQRGAVESEAILDGWGDWLSGMRHRSDYEQILWLQSRTRMPDYIVHGLDRMSMAHSIEARPPFLDHTLWEFCASLPTAFKLRNGTEKYLLREAGRGIVPEAARTRPKRPLQVPYAPWLARHRLPEWAENALGEPQLRATGIFDPGAVAALRRDVQAGEARKSHMLMNVVTLQTWAQLFLISPPSSDSAML